MLIFRSVNFIYKASEGFTVCPAYDTLYPETLHSNDLNLDPSCTPNSTESPLMCYRHLLAKKAALLQLGTVFHVQNLSRQHEYEDRVARRVISSMTRGMHKPYFPFNSKKIFSLRQCWNLSFFYLVQLRNLKSPKGVQTLSSRQRTDWILSLNHCRDQMFLNK